MDRNLKSVGPTMGAKILARWRATYWPARRQIFCVLVPIVLAIMPAIMRTKESRCLYVVLVMGVFWISELLPLAITAFIPLIAYPLLGILPAKAVSKEYLPDSNFIFMGSLIMAIAVERTNLHERVALRVLLCTGTSPRWLMLGFQLATSIISMWITNTASTAMMLPILTRVIVELEKCYKYQKRVKTAENLANSSNAPNLASPTAVNFSPKRAESSVIFYEPNSYCSLDEAVRACEAAARDTAKDALAAGEEDAPEDAELNLELRMRDVQDPGQLRVYKALLLSVCYSASIGGIGTLVGTAPNLVLVDEMNSLYANESPVSFSNWMLFAMPMMLFMLVVCWLWLQIAFIGFGKSDKIAEIAVRRILKRKYKALGPVGYAEGTVIVCFSAQVLIWITRNPGFIHGWATWFEKGYATDGTAAMLVAFMLFVLPARNPWLKYDSASMPQNTPATADGVAGDKWPTILNWKDVKDNFSWGTIFLLGGSFAMAKGVESSGLSKWFSDELMIVNKLPNWLFVSVAILLATALTEFSSNVATASIFIPVLNSIARANATSPLTFVVPVVISVSFAFMFPAGTPPNAIVFSSGLLKVTDMVLAGVVLNVIGLALNVCAIYFGYVDVVFGTHLLPAAWRDDVRPNVTRALNVTL